MTENRPLDPHLAALRAAQAHAEAERWAEVRQMLEGVDLQALLPEYRQHAYHIFGLALLRDGARERAVNVIEEGRRTTKGYCRFDDLLAVIRDEKDPCSPLGELRAAIGEADACLLHDDLPGARVAIDRRIVWQSGEVQSLARLAEVELRTDPDRAIGRFRKALALVRFLDAHRMFAALRKDLPLQGTSWPAPRIADIERRAHAWLDRLGRPEAPSEGNPPIIENPAPVATLPEWSLALNELDAALDAMAVDGRSPRCPPGWHFVSATPNAGSRGSMYCCNGSETAASRRVRWPMPRIFSQQPKRSQMMWILPPSWS